MFDKLFNSKNKKEIIPESEAAWIRSNSIGPTGFGEQLGIVERQINVNLPM